MKRKSFCLLLLLLLTFPFFTSCSKKKINCKPVLKIPIFFYSCEESNPLKHEYQSEIYCENDSLLSKISFSFPSANEYLKNITAIPSFRSNNFRNGEMYGYANINEKKIRKLWVNRIGHLGKWTGVGWTGQVAIRKWTKAEMKMQNIFNQYKQKDSLVEVISAALDGKIHFFDLYSGKNTREKIEMPSSVKGGAWLDPRGYPLLFVGQGINKDEDDNLVKTGFYIFSLINGELLYFINGYDSFAYRQWASFDSNGLIDKNSDCIVLAGENGLIYLGKLNTNYDSIAGKISIKPEILKYRYKTKYNNYYLNFGVENSVSAYKNYAFFADNIGVLQCLDINKAEVVWVQSLGDDTDCSIALEENNDKLFLYAGCELDKKAKDDSVFFRKFDASNGKLIWQKSFFSCYNQEVNGGIVSSPLLGKNKLKDLVFISISRHPNKEDGKLIAINKETGNIVWEHYFDKYSWSSPTAIYNKNGVGYVIIAGLDSKLYLFDGLTGNIEFEFKLDGFVEASPAVYNDIIIIGTRTQLIYALQIY